MREVEKKIIAIIITSDKVYKNLEISRGYHEKDLLGDTDPYSASKAAADISVQSYFHSFLKKIKKLKYVLLELEMLLEEGTGPKVELYLIA